MDALCCIVVISSGQARDEHYPKNPRQPTMTVDVDESDLALFAIMQHKLPYTGAREEMGPVR
jgi:hypothetical protein